MSIRPSGTCRPTSSRLASPARWPPPSRWHADVPRPRTYARQHADPKRTNPNAPEGAAGERHEAIHEVKERAVSSPERLAPAPAPREAGQAPHEQPQVDDRLAARRPDPAGRLLLVAALPVGPPRRHPPHAGAALVAGAGVPRDGGDVPRRGQP